MAASGAEILPRQQAQDWGANVIDRLVGVRKDAFPDMHAWLASNLNSILLFAQPSIARTAIGQQPADQLPWFHIVTLLP